MRDAAKIEHAMAEQGDPDVIMFSYREKNLHFTVQFLCEK